MKDKEEMKAIREAQKRLSWIENVKRVQGLTQEKAEALWTKIYNARKTTFVDLDGNEFELKTLKGRDKTK